MTDDEIRAAAKANLRLLCFALGYFGGSLLAAWIVLKVMLP